MLETWLQESSKQHPVTGHNHTSSSSSTQTGSGIHLSDSEHGSPVGDDNYSLNHMSTTYDPRPQFRNRTTVIRDCDTESRWLLVCAKGKKRPTTLSQLDICATSSDKELFTELKKSYTKFRGKWRQLLSPRRVQSIRFIQVSSQGNVTPTSSNY